MDNFTSDYLKLVLKEFSESNGIQFSNLMKTLRTIISGLKASRLSNR